MKHVSWTNGSLWRVGAARDSELQMNGNNSLVFQFFILLNSALYQFTFINQVRVIIQDCHRMKNWLARWFRSQQHCCTWSNHTSVTSRSLLCWEWTTTQIISVQWWTLSTEGWNRKGLTHTVQCNSWTTASNNMHTKRPVSNKPNIELPDVYETSWST